MTRGFSGAPSLGIGADRSLAFGNYIDYIPITWLVSGATDRAREKKEKTHSAAPLNVTRDMLIAEAPTCSFIEMIISSTKGKRKLTSCSESGERRRILLIECQVITHNEAF